MADADFLQGEKGLEGKMLGEGVREGGSLGVDRLWDGLPGSGQFSVEGWA